MRYAIISDLHANESALRRVLEDAAANGAERVICLGDVVGYGPLPAETVALVRKSAAVTLCGNHDDAVSGRQGADGFIDLAADAVKRHRAALGSDDLSWLKNLPYTCELDGAVAAHGDFTDPQGFNYIDNEADAARNFAATDAQLMFVGHTHVPGFFLTGQSGTVYRMDPQDFVLEPGKRYIVNPGSVGYPRENDGTCLSSYVLYDSTARSVSCRFIPFAVSSVLQRGDSPNRSTAFLVGAVALTVIAVAAAVVIGLRQPLPAPAPRSAVVTPRDLSIVRKSLTLRSSDRYVRANLKIDRKADPVVMKVEFKSTTGDLVGELTETVKGSSGKRLRVPDGALSAHFNLLRQQTNAHPRVISFAPVAQ